MCALPAGWALAQVLVLAQAPASSSRRWATGMSIRQPAAPPAQPSADAGPAKASFAQVALAQEPAYPIQEPYCMQATCSKALALALAQAAATLAHGTAARWCTAKRGCAGRAAQALDTLAPA